VAITLAENAYGISVLKSLRNAVAMVQSDDSYLDGCIATMAITDTERLKNGLKLLERVYFDAR